MRRPRRHVAEPERSGPRVNRAIRVREVFLIDHKGVSHGNMPTEEAMRVADAAGLDLVEVNPTARPPVCKVLDYGKYKYSLQKKKSGQKTRQSKLKEVRLHPRTSEHDVQVRIRQARKFLDHGDKVLVNCWFKGREMAHREFGFKIMDQFKKEFELEAKIEKEPSMEGTRMTMMLAPLAADIKKKLQKEAELKAAKEQIESKTGSGRQRRVITREEAEAEKNQSEEPSDEGSTEEKVEK